MLVSRKTFLLILAAVILAHLVFALPSPQAYWAFDESNGTTAFDSAGSNDANLNGNASWIAGRFGNALSLDGSTAYADSGTGTFGLGQTNELTISFWISVKSQATSTYKTIIARGQYVYPFQVQLYNNKIRTGLQTVDFASVDYLSSTSALSIGQWHHVAFTYTSGSKIIYIDGNINASNSQTGNLKSILANQKTAIGAAFGTTASNFLDADLDDVRIYNTALSAAEVQELYSGTPPGDTTPPITTASPAGGTFPSAQSVTLSRNENGTTHYCLGTACNPTSTYSAPITIPTSDTLRFYSTDTAGNTESTKQEVYTINPACTPSWTCTDWTPTVCPQSQTQTRTCTDSACGNPPRTETQSCTYNPGGNCEANTYYVDFDGGGNDNNDGNCTDRAWKHSPGDPNATAKANKALAAGNTVKFKGGVTYKGNISINASGTSGSQITYSGNSWPGLEGTKAIIDGSEILPGWINCNSAPPASPEQATCQKLPEPLRSNVYYNNLPSGVTAFTSNLAEGENLLEIAQSPNQPDVIFKDDPGNFVKTTDSYEQVLDYRSSPPASPANGDRYLISRTATGAWAGNDIKFAVWDQKSASWVFSSAPQDGRVTYVESSDHTYQYSQSAQNWSINDSVPITTKGFIRDSATFYQADAQYWDGSYVLVWRSPNFTSLSKIISYNPSKNTVFIERLDKNPAGYDKYSIYNSIRAVDKQGEYYINESGKVFLLPLQSTNNITVSVREYGFNIGSSSYITIEGFQIQKFSSEQLTSGIGIGSFTSGSSQKTSIIVKDNWIRRNRHGPVDPGYGGIYLKNCSNSIVENNRIEENVLHAGIFINGGSNVSVRNNEVTRVGTTAIRFYTVQNSEIVGNHVFDNASVHGNGITTYLGCNNILVKNNRVENSQISYTCEDSQNVTLINNLFVSTSGSSSVAIWESSTASTNIRFFNNTFINDGIQYDNALSISPQSKYVVVKNNILAGSCAAASADPTYTYSNNLYVHLCYTQRKRSPYNWVPGPGEIYDPNYADIPFTEVFNADYSLKQGSIAINKGANLSGIVNDDIEGTSRPQDSNWDIGAFEYYTGAPPPACILPKIVCSSVCITPVCTSSTQCNDSNAQTTDACNNAGSCTAVCVHTPIITPTCGNGRIDSGENCSTCPADANCATGMNCCSGTCQASACTTPPNPNPPGNGPGGPGNGTPPTKPPADKNKPNASPGIIKPKAIFKQVVDFGEIQSVSFIDESGNVVKDENAVLQVSMPSGKTIEIKPNTNGEFVFKTEEYGTARFTTNLLGSQVSGEFTVRKTTITAIPGIPLDAKNVEKLAGKEASADNNFLYFLILASITMLVLTTVTAKNYFPKTRFKYLKIIAISAMFMLAPLIAARLFEIPGAVLVFLIQVGIIIKVKQATSKAKTAKESL